MFPSFRHHQPLRRWAARVLLMWLLSLGATVANGCLATAQSAPADATGSPLADAAPGHHGSLPVHTAAIDATALPMHHGMAPDGRGSQAKTNCQDFCAKATVSIPPLKSPLDDASSPAVLLMAGLTVQPVLPAFGPATSWVPRRHGAQAPPIPIAFLRLAL
jgi:hypothetical protein